MTIKVALVACGARKLTTAAPARELYQGTLFKAQRAYAERFADRWFILSAKHGLVEPSATLEPYDASLLTLSTRERDAWGELVFSQLAHRMRSVNVAPVLLAGGAYRAALKGRLVARACEHHKNGRDMWERPADPLARLPIGLQVQWLRSELRAADEARAARARNVAPDATCLFALAAAAVQLSLWGAS